VKDVPFPPGDIHFPEYELADNSGQFSLWRETSFACHLLKQAVNPSLRIDECIANWKKIAAGLAERQRKRVIQMRRLNFI
jgi:hypothetical protein